MFFFLTSCLPAFWHPIIICFSFVWPESVYVSFNFFVTIPDCSFAPVILYLVMSFCVHFLRLSVHTFKVQVPVRSGHSAIRILLCVSLDWKESQPISPCTTAYLLSYYAWAPNANRLTAFWLTSSPGRKITLTIIWPSETWAPHLYLALSARCFTIAAFRPPFVLH